MDGYLGGYVDIINTFRIYILATTDTSLSRSTRSKCVISFIAYLSTSFDGQHFGTSHTLKYDTMETNEGSAFNKFTGTFSAPLDGIYAFSWTIIA